MVVIIFNFPTIVSVDEVVRVSVGVGMKVAVDVGGLVGFATGDVWSGIWAVVEDGWGDNSELLLEDVFSIVSIMANSEFTIVVVGWGVTSELLPEDTSTVVSAPDISEAAAVCCNPVNIRYPPIVSKARKRKINPPTVAIKPMPKFSSRFG